MDCNIEISRVDFTFAAPATLTLTEKICTNRTAFEKARFGLVGWLVVLGLTALCDTISVYIGPSPREREKEERNDS